MVLGTVSTEVYDLPLPTFSPLSTTRLRPETRSEERRRKLPSISVRNTAPRAPLKEKYGVRSSNPSAATRNVPVRGTARRHPLKEKYGVRKKIERFEKPRIKFSNPFAVSRIVDHQRRRRKVLGRRRVVNASTTKDKLKEMPPRAKANVMCYLAASSIPIPLFPKKFIAANGYEQDLNELHTLLNLFGETRVWSIDAEDVCCRYCVDRMRYLDTHHLNRIQWRTKYVANYFLKADCGHRYVFPLKSGVTADDKLKYDIALRRLTHHLGPSSTNRIQNIFLRMKTLDVNTLCSALDIITKTLPNLRNITILLPPPSSKDPVTSISAQRLWRALKHVDSFLPAENTVAIQGLYQQGYEKLEVKWRAARKKLWVRSKETRVLYKRNYERHRRLSLRTDVQEELGYMLPGRSKGYPRAYKGFL